MCVCLWGPKPTPSPSIDNKGSSGENCTLKFIIAMNICGGFAPGDERAESLLQRWELAH